MAKTSRISFRVDETIKTRIRDAAAKEDMTPTEFARRVFQWGMDQYLRVGDWSVLRKQNILIEKRPTYLVRRA